MSTQSRLDTCPRCSGPPTWKTSSRTSPLDLVQSHSSGRLKYPRLFCVDCKLPLRDMHSAAAESYPFEGFGMYPIEISSIRLLFGTCYTRRYLLHERRLPNIIECATDKNSNTWIRRKSKSNNLPIAIGKYYWKLIQSNIALSKLGFEGRLCQEACLTTDLSILGQEISDLVTSVTDQICF